MVSGTQIFRLFSTWPIPFSSTTVDWQCVSVPEKVSTLNCRKLLALVYPSAARRVTMWQLSFCLLYLVIAPNGLSPLCASSSFALLWLSTVDDFLALLGKLWPDPLEWVVVAYEIMAENIMRVCFLDMFPSWLYHFLLICCAISNRLRLSF